MELQFKGICGDISFNGTVKDKDGVEYYVSLSDKEDRNKVLWELNIGESSWGLHRLSSHVPDQVLEMWVNLYPKNEELDDFDVRMILKLTSVETSTSAGEGGGEAFYMDDLEIDLKSYTLNFEDSASYEDSKNTLIASGSGSASARVAVR